MYKCVWLCIYMCFLGLFFGSFSSVFLCCWFCCIPVWFCLILFLFYSLDIYLFSNGKYNGVDIDGRGGRKDLRGTGGGETINKIYCMKKI